MMAVDVSAALVKKYRAPALQFHALYKKGVRSRKVFIEALGLKTVSEYQNARAVLEHLMEDEIIATYEKLRCHEKTQAALCVPRGFVDRIINRRFGIERDIVRAPQTPRGQKHEILRVRPEGYNRAREAAEALGAVQKAGPEYPQINGVSLYPVGIKQKQEAI